MKKVSLQIAYPDRKERSQIVFSVCVILFVLLIVRLGVIQILQYKHYSEIAKENRLRTVTVRACRGKILDRNGRILVTSRASFDVEIFPLQVQDLDSVSRLLSSVLGYDYETLRNRIGRQKRLYPHEPLVIAHDVGMDIITKIQEREEEFSGVKIKFEPIRFYPYGALASHVFGYVGEISEKEVNRLEGYSRGDFIGRTGIEEEYEGVIRGKDGKSLREVDSKGREIGDVGEGFLIPPENGKDLFLTLDFSLQEKIEEIFPKDGRGACVALDPRNGEILAMLSRPSYDPNLFASGISEKTWKILKENPGFPLWNRAVKSGYPPGSVFKIVTAAAGLEEDVIKKETLLSSCYGGYRFGNRIFKCWRGGGHGRYNLIQAIIQSCDVFFYQVGLRLGVKRLSEFAKKCGFGKITGIDIPEETEGFIPSLDFYDRKFGKGGWTEGASLNLAIGQGEILVTPLQLVSYFGAIGMKGVYHKPHLIKKIESNESESLSIKYQNSKNIPVSSENIEILKEGLWGVVNSGWGTGGSAYVSGLNIGGKTGTAQNPHGKDHSLFVAIAPVDSPKIAIAVVVENAGHGSAVAAPIARQAIEFYLTPEEKRIHKSRATFALGELR